MTREEGSLFGLHGVSSGDDGPRFAVNDDFDAIAQAQFAEHTADMALYDLLDENEIAATSRFERPRETSASISRSDGVSARSFP